MQEGVIKKGVCVCVYVYVFIFQDEFELSSRRLDIMEYDLESVIF